MASAPYPASSADAQAVSTPPADDTLDPILITAQREERISSGATGLDLDIKDTPQSISVVTTEQMDQFGANSINDALRLATGINVEEWETNRTNYMARGLEIKNTQTDGVGLPNDWGIVTGAFDSFGYEKLEVIRGANGLLTGVGNASGTINYVRKRPTNTGKGFVDVTGGSWNMKRVEADYSTPLTDSGSWAARGVVAWEDKQSYLRDLDNERLFAYGVVDGQLGEHSTITLGYSYQKANTDGNMWGALVFSNTDGTQARFDTSASTTLDWTYWNTTNQMAFAEYTYDLSQDWQVKASYNHRASTDNSKLFYVYSYTGLDPVTREGLHGWPGRWTGSGSADLGDLALSGRFTAFGREHELMIGLSQASSSTDLDSWPIPSTAPAFGALPAFPYAGDTFADPDWGPRTDYDRSSQMMRRAYGAARLGLAERLKAVVGFNLADYHRQGVDSYGVAFSQSENNFSPYAGLTFDITGNLLAYASYSDIYQPQDQVDINGAYLAPSKGVNYELGLKADWPGSRLLTTLALFSAEQKGLSTFAGINPANGNYYYEGVDVNSEGVELEVSGRLNDYVDLVFGFTTLQLDDEQGADIYTWVPRQTVNLALTSRIPGFTAVTLGLGGKWQSDISTEDGYAAGTIRQGSYATVNAFASWDINEHATVRANINNIADEKYIGSLYQVGYYGPPRNYALTFGYRF